MNKSDGMTYAPKGKPNKVVEEGEFIFSVAMLDHGHIYGMVNGLIEAGGTLKYVYDEDEARMDNFVKEFPMAKKCNDLQTILEDKETKLVASAYITNKRADLGIRVMEAGKDYFTDKAPFTTLDQIERAKETIEKTKQKYLVYYSELIHVEGAIYAKQLVGRGVIGDVIQVMGLGPHRLSPDSRPDWFFDKEQYGGILCDIGSHNIYQYLEFCDIDEAKVVNSSIGNFNNPKYPELDDYGDANFVSDSGQTHYFRVDWFTPDGLGTWGDGRLMVLGTKGYIEVRKYIDAGNSKNGDNVLVVDCSGERYTSVSGQVGFPFFGELILDCINRTEVAQKQVRALKASELSIIAQTSARHLQNKTN